MGKGNTSLATLGLDEYEVITFGALTTATMGNSSPAEVVAANTSRRGLIIANVSDTTGYFSFGDGTDLTTAGVYIKKLAAGETWEILDMRLSQQAIAAVCGAGSKSITFQEAT